MDVARPVEQSTCRSPIASRPFAVTVLVLAIVSWIVFFGGAVFPLAAVAGPLPAIIAGVIWMLPVLVAGPLAWISTPPEMS